MKYTKGIAELVSHMLEGAWRPAPAPLSLSAAHLRAATPAITALGAGGLAWARLRRSECGDGQTARHLQHAYFYNVIETEMRMREIEAAVVALRVAGVEPVLCKGWAVARLYPETGLRPTGDIDLAVHPREYQTALSALGSVGQHRAPRPRQPRPDGGEARLPDRGFPLVDLHEGFDDLKGFDFDDIRERATAVPIGSSTVRVLSPEDHLRLVCVHLWRSSARSPVWLCDIAVMVESCSDGFDWSRCLSGDKHGTRQVLCAIALAHEMVGARVDRLPAFVRLPAVPRWLVDSVRKEWERGRRIHFHDRSILTYLGSPRQLVKALGERWPNSIETTVAFGAPFNAAPRLPLQFSYFLWRAGAFAARTMRHGSGPVVASLCPALREKKRLSCHPEPFGELRVNSAKGLGRRGSFGEPSHPRMTFGRKAASPLAGRLVTPTPSNPGR
ncbi:MAG: nucleotidyltransferase family protein [Chloroflexi bacterium]|nr:nucleotidyltransferase family protein [Chloroflexota bacterium]